ncbi:MAG: TRAP transporter substrate-binding protein DctP [Pseudomonadota bacterium]|nr:TRAP transporter substrate-binding protein DctP [Pseudomonadota bacterium]
MGKFRVISRGIAAAAVLGAVAVSPVQAQKYNFKLTSFVPAKGGFWNNYMGRFINAVDLMTNGQVKIKGYSVGVLAGPFDGWKAVQKGTADICYCYPGFAVNADPSNGIFAGMVGGMPMEEFMHWFVAGEGTKLLTEMRSKTQKLHPVVTGFGPTEIFLHSHRKIQTIADLKGMKIRTAGAWADILKLVGASPTVLPPADIYTALERRVIDGTEFTSPSTNIKLGFHKIAKYIIVPGIHSPSHMNEAVFSESTWKSLPKKIQEQITAAGLYAGFRTAMKAGLDDIQAMETMSKGKNEWVSLTAAAQQKIKDLGREWSFDQAKKQSAKGNPWMAKVAGSYWGFYDRWKKYGTYRHN